MDAQGTIWTSSGPMANDGVRILEGGEISHRIELDRSCFACMLGGPDRRMLFMLTAEWAGTENVAQQVDRRTGRVYVADVEVPGAGWP
ncbi:MAG: hypothetical protein ACLFXM_12170 [Acidimicrobiia bacterium]